MTRALRRPNSRACWIQLSMPACRNTAVSCCASSLVSQSQRGVFHVYSCGPFACVLGFGLVGNKSRHSRAEAEQPSCLVAEHFRLRAPRWHLPAATEMKLGCETFNSGAVRGDSGSPIPRLRISARNACCAVWRQIGIVAGEFEQLSFALSAVLRGQPLPLLNRIDLHGQKYSAACILDGAQISLRTFPQGLKPGSILLIVRHG